MNASIDLIKFNLTGMHANLFSICMFIGSSLDYEGLNGVNNQPQNGLKL